MNPLSVKTQKNVSIQLLRVSACLLVFTVHFGQRIDLSGIARTFTDFGGYGVHLFFLISGFLAGKTFFNNPQVDIKKYYKKRAITILPLYYIVILYYFITENMLSYFGSVIPPDELGLGWLRYIFLLNGFLDRNTYFWSNLGVTWTIPIFCFFYLIAPWLLRKTQTVRSTVFVWAAVFVSTKVFGLLYPCSIFSNLHFLFLGAVIHACVYKNAHKKAKLVFLLLGLCATILNEHTYIYVSIFSILLLALTTIDNVSLPAKAQAVVNTLDKYSYTLYLMHGVVFCSLLDRLKTRGVSTIIIAFIAIVGTFLTTWIVGRFIEKPLQSFLQRKFLNK